MKNTTRKAISNINHELKTLRDRHGALEEELAKLQNNPAQRVTCASRISAIKSEKCSLKRRIAELEGSLKPRVATVNRTPRKHVPLGPLAMVG